LSKTSNFTSGPALIARYSAGLAEYVGVESDELLFEPKSCSNTQLESFRRPKGGPIPTGLNVTMTGGCPNGLANFGTADSDGIRLYDATDRQRAILQWVDQDETGCAPCSVYGDQGTYKLTCIAEKQCYEKEDCSDVSDLTKCPPIPHPSGSDLSDVTSKCSSPFYYALTIGRYAQTAKAPFTFQGLRYLEESPIPLDVNIKNTDAQDLCISFIFMGSGDESPYSSSWHSGTTPQFPQAGLGYRITDPANLSPISTCKTWHENLDAANGYKKSVDQVGTLTLKSGDWSTAIPLWTTNYSRNATSCEGETVSGIGEHRNWVFGCTRTTRAQCTDDCDCCAVYNAFVPLENGCGIMIKEDPCNLPVPCEPLICAYSYSSSFTGTEDCPQSANCNGCEDCKSCSGNCDLCACCGCNCDCDPGPEGHENPCDERQPTPPTTYSGAGKMGCYGSAQEEQIIKTSFDVTLEFLPFTELGGVKQK